MNKVVLAPVGSADLDRDPNGFVTGAFSLGLFAGWPKLNNGLGGAVAGSGGFDEAAVPPKRGFDGVVFDWEFVDGVLGWPKLKRGFAGALAGAVSELD